MSFPFFTPQDRDVAIEAGRRLREITGNALGGAAAAAPQQRPNEQDFRNAGNLAANAGQFLGAAFGTGPGFALTNAERQPTQDIFRAFQFGLPSDVLAGLTGDLDSPGASGTLGFESLASRPQPTVSAPTFAFPDFTGARETLEDARPQRVEGPDKQERIARILGGLAAGSLRGGNQLAGILAGAGAGGTAAVGELSQEQRELDREFERQQQAFGVNQARFETDVAKSLAQVENRQALVQFQADSINAAARQPQTRVLGNGMIALESSEIGPDGQVTRNSQLVDIGQKERDHLIRLAQERRAASAKAGDFVFGSYSRDMHNPRTEQGFVDAAVMGLMMSGPLAPSALEIQAVATLRALGLDASDENNREEVLKLIRGEGSSLQGAVELLGRRDGGIEDFDRRVSQHMMEILTDPVNRELLARSIQAYGNRMDPSVIQDLMLR